MEELMNSINQMTKVGKTLNDAVAEYDLKCDQLLTAAKEIIEMEKNKESNVQKEDMIEIPKQLLYSIMANLSYARNMGACEDSVYYAVEELMKKNEVCHDQCKKNGLLFNKSDIMGMPTIFQSKDLKNPKGYKSTLDFEDSGKKVVDNNNPQVVYYSNILDAISQLLNQ